MVQEQGSIVWVCNHKEKEIKRVSLSKKRCQCVYKGKEEFALEENKEKKKAEV